MIKVLIADDHPLIRAGLKQTLEDVSGITVTGEASNGAEVMRQLQEGSFDVVVLDIAMPGRNGLEVLGDIKLLEKKIPVLVLSTYAEDQYALRAIKAGASGYLTKYCDQETLIKAIKKVASHGKYVSASLAEKLACGLNRDIDKFPHEILSAREYTVLRWIGSGKTVSEISKEMSLSIKTISTYRRRILKKMNLRTNAELTRYCFEYKLVD